MDFIHSHYSADMNHSAWLFKKLQRNHVNYGIFSNLLLQTSFDRSQQIFLKFSLILDMSFEMINVSFFYWKIE